MPPHTGFVGRRARYDTRVQAMKPYVLILVSLASLPLLVAFVARPGRTIVPLYAGLVPAGSALALSVPLPVPFNTPSSLLGGVAIVCLAAHVVVTRRARVPGLAVACWLLFLGWCTASIFWTPEPIVVLHELQVALPLVALLVLVALIRFDERDLDLVRYAIVLGGAAIGAYALYLFATNAVLPSHGLGQRFSLITDPQESNPNQLAAALLLPLALSLHLILEPVRSLQRAVSTIVGASSVVLIGIGLVLTGSRGGMIAAVLGLTAVLILEVRWRPSMRRRVAAVVTWFFVAAVALTLVVVIVRRSSGAIERLIASYPVQRIIESNTGTSGRTEIWTTGAVACRTACAFGTGLGTFADTYTDAYPFSGVDRNVGLERPGHNLYLSIAVEIGLVGLGLFVLAVMAEWAALSATPLAAALGGAVIAVLVADVVEGFLWFKHFWLPFMLVRIATDVRSAARQPERAPVVVGPSGLLIPSPTAEPA
jgi:O-antigen ligase